MNRRQYLLCKLAEEASEIAQIALKTQQFGLDEVYEKESNRVRCHGELNDLLAVVDMLNEEVDFGFVRDTSSRTDKEIKMRKYYDFSISLGEINE